MVLWHPLDTRFFLAHLEHMHFYLLCRPVLQEFSSSKKRVDKFDSVDTLIDCMVIV